MQQIHFNIPIQKVFIREAFLQDFKSCAEQFRPAQLIAMSSYPDHAPTFTALIEDKFLYHYLPIHAFLTHMRVKPPLLNLNDCTPFNCPPGNVAVNQFNTLKACQVYNKNRQLMGHGDYVMTFDWYEDNALCHLINLHDGNIVLAPSHKVIFSSEKNDLPDFKKLHATWSLG